MSATSLSQIAVSVAALLGAITLLILGRALFRALRTRWWCIAQGEVIESCFRERTNRDRYGCRIIDPHVRYAYRVGDEDYTATTVTLSRSNTVGAGDVPLTRAYPVGAKVTVFHHPRRRSQATLRHIPWRARGFAFALALTWTLAFGLASWRHAPISASGAVAVLVDEVTRSATKTHSSPQVGR